MSKLAVCKPLLYWPQYHTWNIFPYFCISIYFFIDEITAHCTYFVGKFYLMCTVGYFREFGKVSRFYYTGLWTRQLISPSFVYESDIQNKITQSLKEKAENSILNKYTHDMQQSKKKNHGQENLRKNISIKIVICKIQYSISSSTNTYKDSCDESHSKVIYICNPYPELRLGNWGFVRTQPVGYQALQLQLEQCCIIQCSLNSVCFQL